MVSWLAPSIRVGYVGLLRRSELLGLEVGMITGPERFPGEAVVTLTKVYVEEGGEKGVGKTERATRDPFVLDASTASLLADHILAHRERPGSRACEACSSDLGLHLGAGVNPHSGCGLAHDAPVWVDPETGNRPYPGTYSKKFKEAAVRACVGHPDYPPTTKALRISGSTLLLDANVPVDTVVRMGRWSSREVLLKHYNRIRDDSMISAVRRLEAGRMGALGIRVTGSVMSEQQEIEYLRAENRRLESELSRLRDFAGDVDPASEAPMVRVSFGQAKGVWVDSARVRAAIRRGENCLAILEDLGLSSASRNYRRLRCFADENDLVLPERFASFRRTAQPNGPDAQSA